MLQENLHQSIHLMEFITKKEYNEISKLQDICNAQDHTNLKLELDYKLHIGSNSKIGTNKMNELLYYVDDTLVGYLGISCFGGNLGEVNGMMHPDWRRKGLFQKLFSLAVTECKTRNFTKLLLLSDGNCAAGIDFIKSVGGSYDSSEYRMKLKSAIPFEGTNQIVLRVSNKDDHKKIVAQNMIFFQDSQEDGDSQIEDNAPNVCTYMVELADKVIGKIKVEFGDNYAFICGFGILPDYRGKGYGKAALKETLRILYEKEITEIELDVVCTNNNALNLYRNCGFEEKSIMNYYQYL